MPNISTTPCVVCQGTICLADATPGSLYANGQQAFACTIHISSLEWSIAWAIFRHQQENAGRT